MMSSIRFADAFGSLIVGKSVVYTSINSPGPTLSASYIGVGDAITETTDANGEISASLLPTKIKVELLKPEPATTFYLDSDANVISASAITGSPCTVYFDLVDIGIDPFATRKVTITPQANYPAFFSGSLICLCATSSRTDASGDLTASIVPGVYLVECFGKVTTPFYISVPVTGEACYASDLIAVKPSKAVKVKVTDTDNSYVLTISASDARYMQRGGSMDSASYAATASVALSGGIENGGSYDISASWASASLSASYLTTTNNYTVNTLNANRLGSIATIISASAIKNNLRITTGDIKINGGVLISYDGDSNYITPEIPEDPININNVLVTNGTVQGRLLGNVTGSVNGTADTASYVSASSIIGTLTSLSSSWASSSMQSQYATQSKNADTASALSTNGLSFGNTSNVKIASLDATSGYPTVYVESLVSDANGFMLPGNGIIPGASNTIELWGTRKGYAQRRIMQIDNTGSIVFTQGSHGQNIVFEDYNGWGRAIIKQSGNSISIPSLVSTYVTASFLTASLRGTADTASYWNSSSIVTALNAKTNATNSVMTGSVNIYGELLVNDVYATSVGSTIGNFDVLTVTDNITCSFITASLRGTADTASYWNSSSIVTALNAKTNATNSVMTGSVNIYGEFTASTANIGFVKAKQISDVDVIEMIGGIIGGDNVISFADSYITFPTLNGTASWAQNTLESNLSRSFCEAYWDGDEFGAVPVYKSNFYTASLVALTDPGNLFWSNAYHVPRSGIYCVTTKLRVSDNVPITQSYGQGADITPQDSPNFMWFETNKDRNGSMNTRTSYFASGSAISLIYYWDYSTNTQITYANMTVQQLYPM